jgi:dTDP-4-dehydrorhamnose reductase
MARAAASLGVPLVHVSTDYVFDGNKHDPYMESDAVAPLNMYGRSKLGGELAISAIAPRHWILRSSWVFSEYGNNFLKSMLRLARDQDTVRVVADQHGRPTYAGDLAQTIVQLVCDPDGRGPWGLRHVIGGPVVTWHDFAVEIMATATRYDLIKAVPRIEGITSTQYSTAARRPKNSVLGTQYGSGALGFDCDWRTGMDRAVSYLRNQSST